MSPAGHAGAAIKKHHVGASRVEGATAPVQRGSGSARASVASRPSAGAGEHGRARRASRTSAAVVTGSVAQLLGAGAAGVRGELAEARSVGVAGPSGSSALAIAESSSLDLGLQAATRTLPGRRSRCTSRWRRGGRRASASRRKTAVTPRPGRRASAAGPVDVGWPLHALHDDAGGDRISGSPGIERELPGDMRAAQARQRLALGGKARIDAGSSPCQA